MHYFGKDCDSTHMYYSYPTSYQFQYNYALQVLFIEKNLSESSVGAWVQDPM